MRPSTATTTSGARMASTNVTTEISVLEQAQQRVREAGGRGAGGHAQRGLGGVRHERRGRADRGAEHDRGERVRDRARARRRRAARRPRGAAASRSRRARGRPPAPCRRSARSPSPRRTGSGPCWSRGTGRRARGPALPSGPGRPASSSGSQARSPAEAASAIASASAGRKSVTIAASMLRA